MGNGPCPSRKVLRKQDEFACGPLGFLLLGELLLDVATLCSPIGCTRLALLIRRGI